MKDVGGIRPGLPVVQLPPGEGSIPKGLAPKDLAPKDSGGFGEVWDRISREVTDRDLLGIGLHKELTTLSQMVSTGKDPSPRELLLYQIRAGQMGVRVELVSKVAESGLQTVRKLQQG